MQYNKLQGIQCDAIKYKSKGKTTWLRQLGKMGEKRQKRKEVLIVGTTS